MSKPRTRTVRLAIVRKIIPILLFSYPSILLPSMAPKFGNYLFRNLKTGSGSPEKAAGDSAGNVSVGEHENRVRPVDFTSEIGAALNWSTHEPRENRGELKQTDAMMESRGTISPKNLRDSYTR